MSIAATFITFISVSPAKDGTWRECHVMPFIPKKTVDGGLTIFGSKVYRRWNGTKWVYKIDHETIEDALNR